VSRCASVEELLATLELSHLAELFEHEEITLDLLIHFDESQLDQLGVTMGAKMRLLSALAQLRTTGR
jgi:hypothetical protein